MRTTLGSCFPTNARMTHRVVLTTAGRQFVFNGHMTVRSTGEMRLAVLGPMGVVADVAVAKDGSIEVRRHNRRFRESWIKKYIARDMVVLFAAPRDAELRAGLLENGTPFLDRRGIDARDVHRYIFDNSGDSWTDLSIYRKGRRYYHAVCTQTKVFPGWDHAIPSCLAVRAKKYQLNISVVDLRSEPGEPRGRVIGNQ